MESANLIFVDYFAFALVVQVQKENVFRALHILKGTVSRLKKARQANLQGSALLCIDVFALESVGVVSAASYLDDFVEASAVTKNHSALSSAFHVLSFNLNPFK